MEEDETQLKRDRIFSAAIILLLCTSVIVTLTIDKKYTWTKELVQTTVKKEGN